MKEPSELLPSFLAELDCSESTKKTYRQVLIIFAKYAATRKKKLTDVSRQDITSFKIHLKNKSASRTIRLYMAVLSKFYTWLSDNSYYENVCKGIKKEPIPKGFKKLPLTIEQAQLLLGAIDQTTSKGKRDYCLINLMLNTGLRRAEVSHINTGDLFYLNGKYAINLQRKGHSIKDQHKVLSPEIYNQLLELAGERRKDPDSPMFLTCVPGMKERRLSSFRIAQIIKSYLAKIGLVNKLYTCHSLRHTTAYVLYKQGMDFHQIMQYMGHQSISTTQLYTQMIREMQSWDDSSAISLNNAFKNGKKEE